MCGGETIVQIDYGKLLIDFQNTNSYSKIESDSD